jgi:hypothetical protein
MTKFELIAGLLIFVGLPLAADVRKNGLDAVLDRPLVAPTHSKFLPPKEYDHEYDGKIIIERMSDPALRAACPGSFKPSNWALGCTKPPSYPGGECIVRILDDAGLRATSWEKDYDIIYRHERGHCNGFRHH